MNWLVKERPDIATDYALNEGGGLAFDLADGRTLNSYPLPLADGYPVGVSVGHDRRVVVATSAGQLYSFSPS